MERSPSRSRSRSRSPSRSRSKSPKRELSPTRAKSPKRMVKELTTFGLQQDAIYNVIAQYLQNHGINPTRVNIKKFITDALLE